MSCCLNVNANLQCQMSAKVNLGCQLVELRLIEKTVCASFQMTSVWTTSLQKAYL